MVHLVRCLTFPSHGDFQSNVVFQTVVSPIQNSRVDAEGDQTKNAIKDWILVGSTGGFMGYECGI